MQIVLLCNQQGRKRLLDTPDRKIKHTVMTETHWERDRILQEKVTRNYYKKYYKKGLQENVTRKGDKKMWQGKVT